MSDSGDSDSVMSVTSTPEVKQTKRPGRLSRYRSKIKEKASGISTTTWIMIGVGVIVALIVLGLAIWGIVWLVRYLGDGSTKLDKPVGTMNISAGPYPVENGLDNSVEGHIDADLYKNNNLQLWGEYGYRAIRITNSTEVVADRSDILWMKRDNLLYIYDHTNRDGNDTTGAKVGFTFFVPRQKSGLIGADIKYELVVKAWDNKDGKGAPVYDTVSIGRADSVTTGVESIELKESILPAENPLLKATA